MNHDQSRDRARGGQHRGWTWRLAVAAAALGLSAGTARAESPGRVEFNRDIRPILSENCFFCHGPDKKHRDSGLRLDIRDEAVAKEAFLPGNPEESELINRIAPDDAFDQTPPPKSNRHLTRTQKHVLIRSLPDAAEHRPP